MQNSIDFIYEYSDLNLFQIRTKVLTGKYSGIILEYGNSVLSQWKESSIDKNSFTFTYTIYQLPINKSSINYSEFHKFLSDLLVAILNAKRSNIDEHEKLMAAAFEKGIQGSILINRDFYPKYERTKNASMVKSTGYIDF